MSEDLTTSERRLLYRIYREFGFDEFSDEDLLRHFPRKKYNLELLALGRKQMFAFLEGNEQIGFGYRELSAQALGEIARIRDSRSISGLIVRHGSKAWAATIAAGVAIILGALGSFGAAIFDFLDLGTQ